MSRPEPPFQPDLTYASVVSFLVLFVAIPAGLVASSLQRLWSQPVDSLLFGPTPAGELMWVAPVALIVVAGPIMTAGRVAHWIRQA